MRALGWMISNTDMAKNHGLMDLFMRESTLQERSMERVFIAGMMDPSIMVIGMRIKSKVLVHIPG